MPFSRNIVIDWNIVSKGAFFFDRNIFFQVISSFVTEQLSLPLSVHLLLCTHFVFSCVLFILSNLSLSYFEFM